MTTPPLLPGWFVDLWLIFGLVFIVLVACASVPGAPQNDVDIEDWDNGLAVVLDPADLEGTDQVEGVRAAPGVEGW